ncbi:MAG: hypothetical protein R6X23_00240 [Acidimicrobiia bacterium]
MGRFKDAKDAMGGIGDLAAGAAAQQQSAEALAASMQAGLTPDSFDPNDPAFAPIDGVDLDAYAKGTAAIAKAGAKDEDEAWAAGGATVGKTGPEWKAINDAWTQRMKESRAVMNQYGLKYQQYA